MLLSLRAATYADIAFLTDVSVEATRDQGRLPADFDEPEWRAGFADWTREQVDGLIPDSSTSVIVVDGVDAGRLRVVRDGGCVELAGIQLLPTYQSRGIGATIVADLLAEARAAGLPLRLKVEKDNPRARRFYDRTGFVQIGEDGNEDVLEHL